MQIEGNESSLNASVLVSRTSKVYGSFQQGTNGRQQGRRITRHVGILDPFGPEFHLERSVADMVA